MIRPIPPASPEEQRRYAARHRTAVRSAVIAGAFSLAVLTLLAANHARVHWADPLDSKKLKVWKKKLLKRPKDEGLKDEIRKLDRSLREEYFRRQSHAKRGAWLLFAGVAALLLALHAAARFRPVPPEPQRHPDAHREIARDTARGRWMTAALGVVVLGGGTAFSFGPHSAPPAAPSRPSGGVPGGRKAPWAQPEKPPSREDIARNWPRFRGPGGLGISAYANIPASWNGKTGQNILWKTKLPLRGASSPILWGDKIFLTGANSSRREVYCLDAKSGAILWTGRVERIPGSPREPPQVGEDTGFAASTPATDGRRVYAIFANGDLGAFDFAGKRVWALSLGIPENPYGHAASLLSYRNLLLVPWDQNEHGALLAFEGATGKITWETPRRMGASWSTPIVARTAAGDQLITSANPKVAAYNPADGQALWFVSGLDGEVAPSPVFGGGRVFAASEGSRLLAIKPGGKGDVTQTRVAWSAGDGLPDTASPLTNGKLIWLLNSGGDLTCYEVKSGRKIYVKELNNGFFASPSLVGKRLLLLSQDGTAYFVSAGRAFKELGRAKLGEGVAASPAFQDGRLYIRGRKHLFCIGAKGGKGQ